MSKDEKLDFDKTLTNAIWDAILHGHGFIRITNNNGLEVHHIKHTEFEAISDLFDWIKKNRAEVDNE
jgi:dissimilatory sulfite reductase (desulfoviridin) alpha/beta subunit